MGMTGAEVEETGAETVVGTGEEAGTGAAPQRALLSASWMIR